MAVVLNIHILFCVLLDATFFISKNFALEFQHSTINDIHMRFIFSKYFHLFLDYCKDYFYFNTSQTN